MAPLGHDGKQSRKRSYRRLAKKPMSEKVDQALAVNLDRPPLPSARYDDRISSSPIHC